MNLAVDNVSIEFYFDNFNFENDEDMGESVVAKRVTNPNRLGTLIEEAIPVQWLLGAGTSPYRHESRHSGTETDGYLHCGACPELVEWVSNEGIAPVNFDNFLVTYLQGKTRQMLEMTTAGTRCVSSSSRYFSGINHYYPYDRKEVRMDGLSISGIDGDYDDYLNKYTSKELQLNGCWAQARALTDMNPDPSGTGEFGSLASSSGLEMFDFHARFYDPQLGRWFTPDPATAGSPYWTEQFHNPYLAMANNPVRYTDPNGMYSGVYDTEFGGGGGNSTNPFGWVSQLNWGANHDSYLPSNSSWLNEYGAHNGSFAPVYHDGHILYYHDGRWGYRKSKPVVNEPFDPGNGAELLQTAEVVDYGTGWVFINQNEITSEIGDHWRSQFFNFQKRNFLASTDKQNIEHIINQMRGARQAGLDHIDLRSIFENYPYLGSNIDLASVIHVNNLNIPMHINLAIYDEMKIDLFKINMNKTVLDYGKFKGIDLSGEYNQWRFSAINGNKPMMLIQFRLSEPNFLYNYIYR